MSCPQGDVELGRGLGRSHTTGSGQSLLLQSQSFQLHGGPKFGMCYFVYCLLCLVMTTTLLAVAAWEFFIPSEEASDWRRRLRPWEEAIEIIVGIALCIEISIVMYLLGWRQGLFLDRWRVLDAFVAGLTLFCGTFFLIRRLAGGVGLGPFLDGVYLPMLGLRFALQPFRILSTASMVVRASRLRQATVIEMTPELPPKPVDPRKPCEGLTRSFLSTELVAQLRDFLPVHLRFDEWELAYSPGVHGTSLSTFYRQQSGPNIIAVQDVHGGIFGAFVLQPWRPTKGAYGMPESFVFVARQPAEKEQDDSSSAEPNLGIFWALQKAGQVVQWSNSKMFGVGHALTVHEDFLHGSTGDCNTFGSAPLSSAGGDFVIRGFECWRVGSGDAADT